MAPGPGIRRGPRRDSRQWVTFSGSARQVEKRLSDGNSQYVVNNETFYANSHSRPFQRFAGVVAGFRALNNFRLKPRHGLHPVSRNQIPKPQTFAHDLRLKI